MLGEWLDGVPVEFEFLDLSLISLPIAPATGGRANTFTTALATAFPAEPWANEVEGKTKHNAMKVAANFIALSPLQVIVNSYCDPSHPKC